MKSLLRFRRHNDREPTASDGRLPRAGRRRSLPSPTLRGPTIRRLVGEFMEGEPSVLFCVAFAVEQNRRILLIAVSQVRIPNLPFWRSVRTIRKNFVDGDKIRRIALRRNQVTNIDSNRQIFRTQGVRGSNPSEDDGDWRINLRIGDKI